MTEHDPSQPNTERRLLLAIVLSMAVLILTPYLYQKFYPPPPEPKAPAVKTAASGEEAQPVAVIPPPSALQVSEVVATSAALQTVEIENADLVLRFSNRGAVLESALLKHYPARKVAAGESQPRLLELIPQRLPEAFLRPLAVRVSDEQLQKIATSVYYEVGGGATGKLKAPAEISFEYRDSRIQISRRVRVPASGYVVEVTTDVRSSNQALPYALHLGPGIGDLDPTAAEEFTDRQIVYLSADSVTRYPPEKLNEGPKSVEASARWVALDSKYFSAVVLDSEAIRGLRLEKNDWKGKNPQGQEQTVALLSAEVKLKEHGKVVLFLGPKDHEILQGVDASLTRLINYGWFAFLVWPLLVSLKFVHEYVHNYGWAIIILTFVINLLLFPLRYKQVVSMKKMAEVQPKLKAIQDKYKRMKRDDPRRAQMNVEVMALYKQHGVNPLGGCLPLVIQMPFLFAFYSMLAYSIELRGAPFMWWIRDLSQHDPFYVTPIIMGISMIVQQKMTPATTADPMQRRMMMLLPVIFTFMFLSLSSGLVLYFLFSNLFAMMFQVLLERWKPELSRARGSKK